MIVMYLDEDGLLEGSSASKGQLRWHLDCAEGNGTLWCPRTSLKINYNANKDDANANSFSRRGDKYEDEHLCVCYCTTSSPNYVPCFRLCMVSAYIVISLLHPKNVSPMRFRNSQFRMSVTRDTSFWRLVFWKDTSYVKMRKHEINDFVA